MVTSPTKLWTMVCPRALPFQSLRLMSSSPSAEAAIKAAVLAKTYHQIPHLLVSMRDGFRDQNPFSFLATFPESQRTQLVDEMLQSFIPLRPRSCLQTAYEFLLSCTLQSSNPLPLAFAVLQRTLRSGCLPTPQTRFLLSSAWLDRRSQSQPVWAALQEMKNIGYSPDSTTCNYLLSSLCAVDQFEEAVEVLKHMSGAGCIPDSESFGAVITAMCKVRRSGDAVSLLKQMVAKAGLVPKQGIVTKVAATLRFKRELWQAVEMIEFLENEGLPVGFESFELVVEGCVERHEYILAAKVVMAMTDRGFVPYIRVRQRLVDGLADVGEWKLACAVRHKFAELGT